jgi:dihydrofolate reductase
VDGALRGTGLLDRPAHWLDRLLFLMSDRVESVVSASHERPTDQAGPTIRRPPTLERATVKLSAMIFLTLDGVYQGPGSADEDRRGGFERGGWLAPYADPEGRRFITSVYERADGLLLGRVTWGIWEAYWPNHDGGDPVSHGINVLPKYVPSTTLTDPTWQNTHVIKGDVEAVVRELKARPGRELQVHGSGMLLRWLIERDLVDELHLLVYPVVVGDGLRLFPERGETHDLRLLDSRSVSSGVTIQTYRPVGRATFGTAG